MVPTQTLSADAKQAEQKKENPKAFVWPKRRRPTDFRGEALTFLSIGLKVLEERGIPQETLKTALWLPIVYRNYSFHTGLRGKQKVMVWNHVRRIIQEAKSVENAK